MRAAARAAATASGAAIDLDDDGGWLREPEAHGCLSPDLQGGRSDRRRRRWERVASDECGWWFACSREPGELAAIEGNRRRPAGRVEAVEAVDHVRLEIDHDVLVGREPTEGNQSAGHRDVGTPHLDGHGMGIGLAWREPKEVADELGRRDRSAERSASRI